jgi:hypothetical protein
MEIVLKFASVVSTNPVHSQGNNPYILEGTEAFTLLVTFLLHYDYIFTEINVLSNVKPLWIPSPGRGDR